MGWVVKSGDYPRYILGPMGPHVLGRTSTIYTPWVPIEQSRRDYILEGLSWLVTGGNSVPALETNVNTRRSKYESLSEVSKDEGVLLWSRSRLSLNYELSVNRFKPVTPNY